VLLVLYKKLIFIFSILLISSCVQNNENSIIKYYCLNKSLAFYNEHINIKKNGFKLANVRKIILNGHNRDVGTDLIFVYQNKNKDDRKLVIAGELNISILIKGGLLKNKNVYNFNDDNVLLFFTTGIPHSANLPLMGYGYSGTIRYEVKNENTIFVKIVGELKISDYITADQSAEFSKKINLEGMFLKKGNI